MDCPEDGRTAGEALRTWSPLRFLLALWRPLDEDKRVERFDDTCCTHVKYSGAVYLHSHQNTW